MSSFKSSNYILTYYFSNAILWVIEAFSPKLSNPFYDYHFSIIYEQVLVFRGRFSNHFSNFLFYFLDYWLCAKRCAKLSIDDMILYIFSSVSIMPDSYYLIVSKNIVDFKDSIFRRACYFDIFRSSFLIKLILVS